MTFPLTSPQTAAEYGAYVSRFEDGCKGYAHISTDGEEYFAWSRCNLCGSVEGGSREDASAIDIESDALVFIGGVCADCVYMLEYGHLDDQTMERCGIAYSD